jgi:hypothetical protein
MTEGNGTHNGNNGKGNTYRAETFIAAIPGTGGIISAIARRVGCAWHTAQKHIRTMPTVAAAYADECEGITDLAESTVIKAIQAGDVGTARWYLATKGKERGFTERRELTGADAGPIEIVMNWGDDESELDFATAAPVAADGTP